MSTDGYLGVADALRRRIAHGAYKSGELPPAALLAADFGVGLRTIQRALSELDRVGLTVSRQGRPRIVRADGGAATRYEQIAAGLRARIASGDLAPGARVPPERDLISTYEAARATVREALDLLERDGQIVKRAGRRYVSGDESSVDLRYGRVAAELRERISRGVYPAEQRLPGELALAEEFEVSRPTVREALTRLGREGLVKAEPKRGWFVTARRTARAPRG